MRSRFSAIAFVMIAALAVGCDNDDDNTGGSDTGTDSTNDTGGGDTGGDDTGGDDTGGDDTGGDASVSDPCDSTTAMTGNTATVVIAGAGSALTGSCGGDGPEVVLEWTADATDSFTATATVDDSTDTDTVVYVQSTCGDAGSELGCNDDASGTTFGSAATFDAVAGTTYFIVVDTYDADSIGTVQVSVDAVVPPECGDGIVNGEDICDGDASIDPNECSEFGYDSGTATCSDACTIDLSACVIASTETTNTCDAPGTITLTDGSWSETVTNVGWPDAQRSSQSILNSQELVYAFTPDADGDYTITTGPANTPAVEGDASDTVVYVRTDCGDDASEVAFGDDIDFFGDNYFTEITLSATASTTYYIIVETFSPAEAGPFTLTVSAPTE